MNHIRITEKKSLQERYPPSESCSCKICSHFCNRPGWWTVEEANKAMNSGFANRMMLEVSDNLKFGVLSPAFKGNEGEYALQIFANRSCTFHKNGFCEIYFTDLMPLECRFCHHSRLGLGLKCHLEIEKEWNSEKAKRVIIKWGNLIGFWQRKGLMVIEK